MDPIVTLAALSALFLATHVGPSHPPVRRRLVARVGAGPYLALYSLVSLAVWAPLVWVWFTHRHAGALLWALRSPGWTHLAEGVALTGLGLVVASLVQPAPSLVGAQLAGAIDGPVVEVRGMAHVTRHPLLVGLGLLTGAHLVGNGWLGDVLFFGSHVALALVGAVHQDQRLTAARSGYAAFAARTTLWPNPLGLARIGGRAWAGFALGIALGIAARYAHRFL